MIDNEVLELGNLSNKGHILPHETIHSLAQNTDLSQRSVNWQYVVLPESVNFETFLLLVFCWQPLIVKRPFAPGTMCVDPTGSCYYGLSTCSKAFLNAVGIAISKGKGTVFVNL